MIVRTTWHFREAPEVVWPLLCDSRMAPGQSCLFRLGVPRPEQCRLPDGTGAVGNARQCVSDRGVIEQRIVAWDEPRRLAFRMERTDLAFRAWVTDMVDEFELVATAGGGTRATRTTTVRPGGVCAWAKRPMLWLGLKNVHRFVFRNWARLARAAA